MRSRASIAVGALGLSLALATAQPAAAQSVPAQPAAAQPVPAQPVPAQPEEPVPDQARALFAQGLAAFDGGDLVRAESLFRRSLELRRSGSAAYNLANVLEQTGRLVEARALFEEVGAMAEVPAPVAAQAAQSRAALEVRIARVTIRAAAPDGVEARIDGVRVPLDVEQLLDPGQCFVLVQRDGVTVLEEPVRLREGERRTVEVPSFVASEAEADPPPSPSGQLGAGPWVLLGAGVAGAVVGTVLAVVAHDQRSAAMAEPAFDRATALNDEASALWIGAQATLWAAGALAAAGLVWLVVELTSAGSDDARAALELGPLGASVRGAF